MQVSKEEIMHIAKLAKINIEENEIEKYRENLQEILNFAQIVNEASTEGVDITIGANENQNVFRKDEIVNFEDKEALMKNAPSAEQNMFKIPKVIQ